MNEKQNKQEQTMASVARFGAVLARRQAQCVARRTMASCTNARTVLSARTRVLAGCFAAAAAGTVVATAFSGANVVLAQQQSSPLQVAQQAEAMYGSSPKVCLCLCVCVCVFVFVCVCVIVFMFVLVLVRGLVFACVHAHLCYSNKPKQTHHSTLPSCSRPFMT